MSLKDRRGFIYVTEDVGGVLWLVLEKALEGYISQDVNFVTPDQLLGKEYTYEAQIGRDCTFDGQVPRIGR